MRSFGSKMYNQPNCIIIVHEITEVYCPVLSLSHSQLAVYNVIGLHNRLMHKPRPQATPKFYLTAVVAR